MKTVTDFREYVAYKIKSAREWNNFTQSYVAREVGISRQTYLDLEAGRTEPKLLIMLSLCKVLKRNLNYFIGGEPHPHPLSSYNTDDLLNELRKRVK